MPGYDKIPTYLTPEQRNALTHIPPDLSDRDIARYYTFTEKERALINRRRREANRLGFAVQLALLKFPGRTLMEVKEVPKPVLAAVAEQVGVPVAAFASYGERENTLYEHLNELRRECGFRSCGWREYLLVARALLSDAMESDRPLPLIEKALEILRTKGILAPNLIHVERLVWMVLKIAERRLLHTFTQPLTLEQRIRLDGLLHADPSLGGATRLSWLRQPPGVTSPKSIKRLAERLSFLRDLALPALTVTLHQNRVLQLAHKCSKYQAQPLLHLPRDRRHALLLAYLFEVSQDLTDQALDQFDKLLGKLLRKGERRQEKYLRMNSRKMNSHLTILTTAMEAFLKARTEGHDPVPGQTAQARHLQRAAVGKVKMKAPLGHLSGKWRKHALSGEKITPNYYEAAAFEALKGRVRSGDVAVSGSRRYRSFENYLLSPAYFEHLTEKQLTRLAVEPDAQAYLADKQQGITQKLTALQDSIGKVEGSLVLDEKGHLHLPPLEKAVPEEVERLKKRVYALLPHLPLADLLLEVDNWTGFLRHFTHLTSGDAPVGEQKLELVAALMGMGMNLGLEKMAESCPIAIGSSPGRSTGISERKRCSQRWPSWITLCLRLRSCLPGETEVNWTRL